MHLLTKITVSKCLWIFFCVCFSPDGRWTGSLETHWTSHNTPEEAEDFGRQRCRPSSDETNAATQCCLNRLEHDLVPDAVFADDSSVMKNHQVCNVLSYLLPRHEEWGTLQYLVQNVDEDTPVMNSDASGNIFSKMLQRTCPSCTRPVISPLICCQVSADKRRQILVQLVKPSNQTTKHPPHFKLCHHKESLKQVVLFLSFECNLPCHLLDHKLNTLHTTGYLWWLASLITGLSYLLHHSHLFHCSMLFTFWVHPPCSWGPCWRGSAWRHCCWHPSSPVAKAQVTEQFWQRHTNSMTLLLTPVITWQKTQVHVISQFS